MTQGTRGLLVPVYTFLLCVDLQGFHFSENVHVQQWKTKISLVNEIPFPHLVLNREGQDTNMALKPYSNL